MFGEILIVDVGHVIDSEATGAKRGIEIFASKLQIEHVAFVMKEGKVYKQGD